MSFVIQRTGDECVDCGEALEPGQVATYIGQRDLAHEHCPKRQPPCPFCWLQHAGECA
jgi:hypothetical protein